MFRTFAFTAFVLLLAASAVASAGGGSRAPISPSASEAAPALLSLVIQPRYQPFHVGGNMQFDAIVTNVSDRLLAGTIVMTHLFLESTPRDYKLKWSSCALPYTGPYFLSSPDAHPTPTATETLSPAVLDDESFGRDDDLSKAYVSIVLGPKQQVRIARAANMVCTARNLTAGSYSVAGIFDIGFSDGSRADVASEPVPFFVDSGPTPDPIQIQTPIPSVTSNP